MSEMLNAELELGSIVSLIGVLSILFGAYDIFSFEEGDSFKKPAVRIIGGIIVAGIGYALTIFGM